MFVTLRYGQNEGEEAQFVERSTKPPRQGSINPHFACNACRQQKIGCSGEKTGCARCCSRNEKCNYVNNRPGGGKKRKHRYDKSAETVMAIASPPSSSNDIDTQTVPSAVVSARASTSNSLADINSEITGRLQKTTQVPESTVKEIASSITHTSLSGHNGRTGSIAGVVKNTNGTIGSPPQLSTAQLSPNTQRHYSDEDVCSKMFGRFNSDDYDMLTCDLQDFSDQTATGTGMTDSDMICTDPSNFFFDSSAFVTNNALELSTLPTPTISSTTSSSRNSELSTTGSHSRVETLSSRPGTSRRNTKSDTSKVSCTCPMTALRILEALAIPSRTDDISTVEQALYFLKRNIGQCHALAQCSACGRESHFCILVVMLCEKMTGVFEDIVVGWERQLDIQARPVQWPRVGGTGAGASENASILIGEYQMDTDEERLEVFGTLVQLQLKKLENLLRELKKNAVGANWESHLVILTPVSARISTLNSMLERLGN